jgi:hypothetical protein
MSDYIPDNLGLWQKHDAAQEEFSQKMKKHMELIDTATDGIERALIVLDDDFDKGCDMLRDLVSRLEDER